jgi:hypothetical protein
MVMYYLQKGSLEDVIAVDFQLIHCGSPASDFIYFIFGATDQTFRKAHLDNLKNLYYDTFEEFLKYFGIEAKIVYSKKEFEYDFQKHLVYGLSCSLLLLPILFSNDDQLITVDGYQNYQFQWNDKAKERWQGTVEDFIQWKGL